MKIIFGFCAAWLVCAAALPLSASETPPLGSPDFHPSPEHPVGWRGDGSGRFPGATPPTVWSRRLADITSEIWVQATKPSSNSKPGADSHILAYFTVKDWLIAGPFPAPEPEKDIEHDFLGGESDVQPDAGANAGTTQWKVLRAYEGSQSYYNFTEPTLTHLWVDFVYALGTLIPPKDAPSQHVVAEYASLDQQAAYAHTYLYAPRDADVEMDLLHEMPAVKMWVNGAPRLVPKAANADLKIHLNAGWNRILIKAICDKAQLPWTNKYAMPNNVLGRIRWRFAAYIRPVGSRKSYSGGYETKNIAWMVKLTGRNMSQPIVAGDKVFVGGGSTDLFCIDKRSGKILWMHTGTYWDAMTAEERAAVKDKAEPLLTKLDKDNLELIALLNANVTSQGVDASKQAAIDTNLNERRKFIKTVHDALSTGQKGKLYLNEVSAGNATPTSDGQRVYWVIQGNGGYLTSAFDLDGKLIWSNFEFQPKGAGEHGSHRSPLLCENKLIVSTNEMLIAYDAVLGKELWRTPGSPNQHGVNGSPILVQFDGKRALQTSNNLVSLDGAILASGGYETFGAYLPIVEDGVLYNSCNSAHAFQAVAIAKHAGDKPTLSWNVDRTTLYGSLINNMLFFYIASPLYVNGLVYQMLPAGNLVVIDTHEKKPVYQRWMDGYNFSDRSLYGYCASPTLAGKNIYLLDEVGYMTVLKPGADGTVEGRNILQNLTALPESAPGRSEVFNAGMYFEGNRIFLHGDEYLYCIAEK